MVDTPITGLPLASSLTGLESIPIIQGGINRRTTPQQIASYAAAAGTIGALLDYQYSPITVNIDITGGGTGTPLNWHKAQLGLFSLVMGRIDPYDADGLLEITIPNDIFATFNTMIIAPNFAEPAQSFGITGTSIDTFFVNRVDSLNGNTPVSILVIGETFA